ncbi:hypothetical protein ND748_06055 [Frankia sp. AiPs1]|uniref:hypothetical protein n=1 Tax=Frankia sp. AiPs1 TaxID=573493 RepID=UPI002043D4C5|nr:hypothetical protein [Frankia sp. AiPs1]MCM3921239.1 hypothetical protein [Frankia sp. AiPs1]
MPGSTAARTSTADIDAAVAAGRAALAAAPAGDPDRPELLVALARSLRARPLVPSGRRPGHRHRRGG